MAREVMITSDISGKPGAKTYRVNFDSQEWTVDLTDKEAEPLLELVRHGRMTEQGSALRAAGPRGLESRIRNAPDRHAEG